MSRWRHRWATTAVTSLAMIGALVFDQPTAFGKQGTSIAPSFPREPKPSETMRLSQLFYPPATDKKMVRVIGKGTVRQAADIAEIQILVDKQENYDDSAPFESPNQGFPSIPLEPPGARETIQGFDAPRLALNDQGELTDEDFSLLVQALAKSGISRSDISVKIQKSRPKISSFPFPSLGNSSKSFVLVKVRNPTPNKIESVVVTAENHLQESQTLSLDDVKVNYKINECEQVKLKAFENAVTDAQKRAETIASAMKAKLSASASVAEPFFNMFVPGCESKKGFSLSGKKATSYEPGAPLEVVIDRIIFFTYTIEE